MRVQREQRMPTTLFKITAATALFAGVHSLLASRAAKRAAVRLLGERRRNVLYRPLYNAQAVLTFGALVVYGARLPDRELYRVRGLLARGMQAGQVVALVCLLDGTRRVGFLRFLGVPNLVAAFAGDRNVTAEPEAQGPAPDADGRLNTSGPFRVCRHPLNAAMLPVLWLMPRMTANLLAFNAVTTIYLVLGSLHEEKRLEESYGEAYNEYRKSGAGFLAPSITRLLR